VKAARAARNATPSRRRSSPGDEIVYEIVDDRVILTKARRGGKTDDPFRTFKEWGGEADTRAYADL
jgi:hypothetical protein